MSTTTVTTVTKPESEPSTPLAEHVPEPKAFGRGGARPLFEGPIVRRAIRDSFAKLHPRHQLRNPVMFVVEVGSVLTTLLFVFSLTGTLSEAPGFILAVSVWLWFTVLFANFAEAMAEGRGKAQADTLRRTRSETTARVRRPDGSIEERPSSLLQVGDR